MFYAVLKAFINENNFVTKLLKLTIDGNQVNNSILYVLMLTFLLIKITFWNYRNLKYL